MARDYIRKEGSDRSPFVELDAEPDHCTFVLEGVDAGADPALQALAKERHELMRALFASLSTEDQQLLLLDEDGLSSEDIAGKTGLSRQAVYSRLSRLKRRLLAETAA